MFLRGRVSILDFLNKNYYKLFKRVVTRYIFLTKCTFFTPRRSSVFLFISLVLSLSLTLSLSFSLLIFRSLPERPSVTETGPCSEYSNIQAIFFPFKSNHQQPAGQLNQTRIPKQTASTCAPRGPERYWMCYSCTPRKRRMI